MKDKNAQIVRWHRVSQWLLILVSYLSIINGAMSPLMTVIMGLGLALAVYLEQRGSLKGVPQNVWNVGVLTAIGISVGEAVLLTEFDGLALGVRFICLLLIIKVVSRAGPRDDWQVYALSFLLFAASTSVHEDIIFGLFFTLFVVIGTVSLALFHLRIEAEELAESPRMRLSAMAVVPPTSQAMILLGTIGALILLSSFGIFFTFPRVGLGFFAPQTRDATSMTGFSDSVELGDHGRMRDNPEVVLRVDLGDGLVPYDYRSWHWKMLSFDQYDGRRWRRRLADEEKTYLPRVRRTYRWDLAKRHGPALQEMLPKQKARRFKIYLEPLGKDLLPTIWPTREVELSQAKGSIMFSQRRGFLKLDGYGDLRHTIRSEFGVSYSFDAIAPPSQAALDASSDRYQASIRAYYLQMPQVIGPRVEQLSQRVSGSASTPFGKARAIVTHLQNSYAYTTDLPKVDPSNPVESFLFDTRRGHCEYFATSAVMMMRSVGVPARLVNGFLGGTHNELGNFVAVRQGDAHSWVEVYSPEYGWVPMDPTPAAGTMPHQAGPLQQYLRDSYDAMRLAWMRNVIEYDLESQIKFLRQASDLFTPAGGSSSQESEEEDEEEGGGLPLREIIRWTGYLFVSLLGGWWIRRRKVLDSRVRKVIVLVLVGAMGLGWFAWFWGVDPRWRLVFGPLGPWVCAALSYLIWLKPRFGTPRERATTMFARIEQAAAARELARSIDEGPSDYLERLGEALPVARGACGEFSQIYLAARFGGRSLDEASLRRLQGNADRIIAALRGYSAR